MDFTPGYVLRALDYLPKSGHVAPWRLKQNYLLDLRLIRRGKVDDEALAVHQTPCAGEGFGLVPLRVSADHYPPTIRWVMATGSGQHATST